MCGRPTHHRPTHSRGHPSPQPRRHWRFCNLHGDTQCGGDTSPNGVPRDHLGVVHGAHGKPLQIAGKTQHLDLQWGEARSCASFIVIIGLELPPCLIGKDIMQPLRVRIDVTNGTATPAQPDPKTVHLNAAQHQKKAEPPQDAARQPPRESVPNAAQQQKKLSNLEMPLTSRYPPRHKKVYRRPPLPTPLAALCCSKPQTSLQRLHG